MLLSRSTLRLTTVSNPSTNQLPLFHFEGQRLTASCHSCCHLCFIPKSPLHSEMDQIWKLASFLFRRVKDNGSFRGLSCNSCFVWGGGWGWGWGNCTFWGWTVTLCENGTSVIIDSSWRVFYRKHERVFLLWPIHTFTSLSHGPFLPLIYKEISCTLSVYRMFPYLQRVLFSAYFIHRLGSSFTFIIIMG